MRGLLTILILLCKIDFAIAVPTVSNVDLERYSGQWYEVASIPSSSQKNCLKNSKSRYQLRKDGKIDVRSTCIKSSGQREVANGVAEIVNHENNAELKVSFVPILQEFGLFAGQYKIVALDPNYQYAVIGEDYLENGWIISRKSGLPLNVLSQLETEIRSLGYDSCRFLTSVQDSGFYTKRRSICDVIKNSSRSLINSEIF